MTLPSNGSSISWTQIQTEFGGANPISLSEYYAGAGYTPGGTVGQNGAIPSSGAISAYNMFGATADPLAGLTFLYTVSYTTYQTSTSPHANTASAYKIKLWGGGGMGARELNGSIASGGASGAYCEKVVTGINPVTTYTIAIALAASSAGTTNRDGANGNTTSIASLGLTATGGQGGKLNGAAAIGGTASGGTVNTAGNNSIANTATGMGSPNGGVNSTTYGSAPGGGGAAYRLAVTTMYYYGNSGRIDFDVYGTPGIVTNVISMAGIELVDFGLAPGICSAGVNVKSNGQIFAYLGGADAIFSDATAPNWYAPTTTSIGTSWWVKANFVSGSLSLNLGTVAGTWYQLTQDRLFGLSVASGTVTGRYAFANITLSFSNDGGSTTLFTTSNMYIETNLEQG